MSTSKPQNKTIDDYIAEFPKDVQEIMYKLRKIIKAVAPEAIESISYGMAAFKLKGKPLVYFAGWKSHIGIYALPSGTEQFKKELSNFATSKGAVKFPIDKPIPYDSIKRVIEFRVKENLSKKTKTY
jgi:uncharacterized protein YdhG (YjbR/CyaY superfamily)